MKNKMIQLLMADMFLVPKEVVVEYISNKKKEVNYYNDFSYEEAIDIYLDHEDALVNYVVLNTMIMIIFVAPSGKKEFKIYKEV